MIVGSRKKKTANQSVDKERSKDLMPESNEEFIQRSIETRDYHGAVTFIEFIRDELNQPYTKDMALWHGYSLFHLGKYSEAIDVYEKLLKSDPDDTNIHLLISSCQFYNRDYEEARASALRGPHCDFQIRLLFHIAHQMKDEQEVLQAHSQLVGTLENELSLAAIHYLRADYQEALEIYQRLLLQNPEYIALNVYIGMCHFKQDNFQESNDSTDIYLGEFSDSAVALNLKSCDYLRIFEPTYAESQLLQIRKYSSASYDFVDALVAHNLCIFHDGENGFTVLPKLVPHLSEARYNLAILYMRESNAEEAFNLIQDYIPLETCETSLKAAVLLAMGQHNSEEALIVEANEMYQEVGSSETICDTIPGRQALATNKFIMQEYDNTLRILQTIEEHVEGLDEYNYNKAMTLAALSKWAEAERYFLMVKSLSYTKEIYYTSWLCKCFLHNGKPESAWNLYVEATSQEDSKLLLNLIASECFTLQQFYYSMKAYDTLAKYEMDPHFRDGMIASAVGVFRGILTKKEDADKLTEVISILSTEPEAATVLQAIQQYAMDSGLGYDDEM